MPTKIAVIYCSSTGHVHQMVPEATREVSDVDEQVLAAARCQGHRLARFAERLAAVPAAA